MLRRGLTVLLAVSCLPAAHAALLPEGGPVLVSADPEGGPGNHHSTNPDLARDGRFVAFVSSASDLVPGDTNGRPDVFVRDLILQETARVGDLASPFRPAISADGGVVAYVRGSSATLVDRAAGTTTALPREADEWTSAVALSDDGAVVAWQTDRGIHVLDRGTGEVREAAVLPDGRTARAFDLALSGDGSRVAFTACCGALGGDTVFVRDLAAASTREVTVGHPTSFRPALSADGRVVAWLGFNRVNSQTDVLVVDLATGDLDLLPSGADGYGRPSLDATGARVAFMSFVPVQGVYVWDRATGSVTLASEPGLWPVVEGNGDAPSLSGDGRSVAFHAFDRDPLLGNVWLRHLG